MGKTSWQAKARYNAKTYKNLSVRLKPELYEEFERLRSKTEFSKPEFIRKLIENYIENIKKGENNEYKAINGTDK